MLLERCRTGVIVTEMTHRALRPSYEINYKFNCKSNCVINYVNMCFSSPIICFTFYLYQQTYFLPVIGLVDAEKLKPGDLVGVNKDSYLILETLPAEYDARVKAMEVDERPTEQYSDIGGLDKQIQEVRSEESNLSSHRTKRSIAVLLLSC